jgi:hypothetical protein
MLLVHMLDGLTSWVQRHQQRLGFHLDLIFPNSLVGDSDGDGDAAARIHPGILYSRATRRPSTAIQPVYVNGKHSTSVVILVDVWDRLKLLIFSLLAHAVVTGRFLRR